MKAVLNFKGILWPNEYKKPQKKGGSCLIVTVVSHFYHSKLIRQKISLHNVNIMYIKKAYSFCLQFSLFIRTKNLIQISKSVLTGCNKKLLFFRKYNFVQMTTVQFTIKNFVPRLQIQPCTTLSFQFTLLKREKEALIN